MARTASLALLLVCPHCSESSQTPVDAAAGDGVSPGDSARTESSRDRSGTVADAALGPCPDKPLRHQVVSALKQDIASAMTADKTTETTPKVAYVATMESFAYIFDTSKWLNHQEEIKLFATKAEVQALPAGSALLQVVNSLNIDWSQEALVAMLEYPSQYIYRYGVKGTAFKLYAGHADPCDAYGTSEISLIFQRSTVVRLYSVKGAKSVSLQVFSRKYRFNPVGLQTRCQRKGAAVGGGGRAAVLFDSSLYRMWLGGYSAMMGNIFLSTSTDGDKWTPAQTDQSQRCVFSGYDPNYPQNYDPGVIKVSGTFWMYYTHYYSTVGSKAYIVRSTSQDGKSWSQGTKVLDVGASGQWDDGWVGEPFVVVRNGKYLLYYVGYRRDGYLYSIGLATSTDGLTFTRSSANPVLAPGKEGTFDDLAVAGPSVIDDGKRLLMLYTAHTGGGSAHAPARTYLAVATSTDGVTWQRPSAPDLGPAGSGEFYVIAPEGEVTKGQLRIWYTAINDHYEPTTRIALCSTAP